jgi:hypothetical protein
LAEELGKGLQNPVHGCDSRTRLHARTRPFILNSILGIHHRLSSSVFGRLLLYPKLYSSQLGDPCFFMYNALQRFTLWASGGIGIHSGLKIRAFRHEGSTPSSPTIKNDWFLPVFFNALMDWGRTGMLGEAFPGTRSPKCQKRILGCAQAQGDPLLAHHVGIHSDQPRKSANKWRFFCLASIKHSCLQNCLISRRIANYV